VTQFSLGILVIEHDMKLVMGICEQLTVLDHGETIARGEPAAVRATPRSSRRTSARAPAHD
jgi:branched-chain amino acid transport system ATP-binding protein